MKKVITILAILIMASTGIITVYGAQQQSLPPPFLKGNRINVGLLTQEIDASEPSFVIHGFLAGGIPWKDLSPVEKKGWMKGATFELKIDDNPVEMKRWIHFYKVYVNPAGVVYENVMVIGFYVKFDANEFESGDYKFQGTWTDPYGNIFINTSIVTFTN
jgi:hypothetical protein